MKLIKVNNRDHEWKKGMTVQDVLEELNYTYPVLVVMVRGEHIDKSMYPNTIIYDGDEVKILHPICGG